MSVPFRLSKVRLINWHNFIDETIEVDGSLFLIGDNGSGKTTLLDAIHCALTGDWKVELNAAARVGGRREEGRDLVGIVLRKDFEKGFGRPDGAIAYSALEFRRDLPGARQGACLSVGIGVYVPSAESRPEKWGFVVPRSLEEVSLTRAVERRNGSTRAERPSDRSELASHLGPGHVFDIGRYRSRLGERLYGSRDNLEQVATFLQAGKAYRELVAKTTNFSELFAGLLPLPDVETFLEVRRALDAIERTRIDLEALDEELLRLHTLIGWLGDIAEERQTVARYDYLAARFARERARETLAVLRAELERVRIDHERVSNELRDVDGRIETLGAELDRLRASQGANLLARYREQSGEL
ncbi:MAG TPA: ATP-binding protein, partial [Planctomycetota bacterium]|nr:ATP-binding protein [Planctomycetota bacterium]